MKIWSRFGTKLSMVNAQVRGFGGAKCTPDLLKDTQIYLGYVPLPRMPVTTRIITFLVGNPYKPSFATITGKGDNPKYTR